MFIKPLLDIMSISEEYGAFKVLVSEYLVWYFNGGMCGLGK